MTARSTDGPDRHAGAQRVAVIGAGYVGLPTAAVLARFGHHVACAERDPDRLRALARGELPIVEPGLDDLVRRGRDDGLLRFVDTAAEAVTGAAFVFLCVATPQCPDGSADLSDVAAVAEEVAPHLAPGAIVVNKSTVPVGTATLVERVTGRTDVSVVANPEFLREGSAVEDSLHPDRVVVGSDDRAAAQRVAALFAPTGSPCVVTDPVSAEAIKYASNAFLATKLSFVNALAGLCEAVGADAADVLQGLGSDHRVGFDFLHPGPGWGGSCLPKDTRALLRMAEDAGYDFGLLQAAVATNDRQLDRVERLVSAFATGAPPGAAGPERLDGATVALWGLTFKAGTDDRRCSPAVAVARRLLARGAAVRAYDPTVLPTDDPGEDLEGLVLCADPYEACRDAAVAVVLTEWEELRCLDFAKVRELLRRPAVVDARNLLDPAALRRLGFDYAGVGRR